MFKEGVFNQRGFGTPARLTAGSGRNAVARSASRKLVIGIFLVVALFAFELFNFDTTRFALDYILGDVSFWGVRWATILAVAFCAIDFAGLARLFTPEQGAEEPKAVWYLMGAWLLGATMNALMTWWAVSLTLLSHDFGNEVLSREQLLHIVPIFVASLVWLTRILFIGSLSVAGERLLDQTVKEEPARASVARPTKIAPARRSAASDTRSKSNPVSRQGHTRQPAPMMARQGSSHGRAAPVRSGSLGGRSRPSPIVMRARGRQR